MALLEAWALLEFDFQQILHIDLDRAWHDPATTYRWFTVRVRGLLRTADSRIAKHFSQEVVVDE